ncbi:hypothetical protein [Ideonella sp.]|uniref:hypothetical protein n=1 Tax=Ideonella sp. TaxID=1929293 RepID=UPI0035B06BC6
MIPTSPASPLHSLDAWPGESARPPLRLLERRDAMRPARRAARPASGQAHGHAHWLQRLQRALGIA